jgi:hypothetical protein
MEETIFFSALGEKTRKMENEQIAMCINKG